MRGSPLRTKISSLTLKVLLAEPYLCGDNDWAVDSAPLTHLSCQFAKSKPLQIASFAVAMASSVSVLIKRIKVWCWCLVLPVLVQRMKTVVKW